MGEDLSIMTEPGMGLSIDQEKTLCGIAAQTIVLRAGVWCGEGGGTIGSSKLACRGAFVIGL